MLSAKWVGLRVIHFVAKKWPDPSWHEYPRRTVGDHDVRARFCHVCPCGLDCCQGAGERGTSAPALDDTVQIPRSCSCFSDSRGHAFYHRTGRGSVCPAEWREQCDRAHAACGNSGCTGPRGNVRAASRRVVHAQHCGAAGSSHWSRQRSALEKFEQPPHRRPGIARPRVPHRRCALEVTTRRGERPFSRVNRTEHRIPAMERLERASQASLYPSCEAISAVVQLPGPEDQTYAGQLHDSRSRYRRVRHHGCHRSPGRRDGIRSLWRRADHSNLASLPRTAENIAR